MDHNQKTLGHLENIVKFIVAEYGISMFTNALHNVSAHGYIFEVCDRGDVLDSDDNNLKKWFECLEGMLKIVD